MEDEESPSESTSRSTFRRIQETRSSNYSTYKMNMHVEKNLINLNNVLAGNETNNIEPNSQSNISLKTTKTKTNVWKHVIQQSSGEIKCNLCSSSSKSFGKSNSASDSKLRSHLSRIHQFKTFS